MTSPRFFRTGATFRAWLEKNHGHAAELWVGFHRKNSGKPSITWPESVDEALCFGWIDGIRKSHDAANYKIRFTPRRPDSIWSNVNIAKIAVLIEQNRMTPAGLLAYSRRDERRSGVYRYEQKTINRETVELDEESELLFRRNRHAWAFFQSQAPYYRRIATLYVMSAKRPETRARRLAALIARSTLGERIA